MTKISLFSMRAPLRGANAENFAPCVKAVAFLLKGQRDVKAHALRFRARESTFVRAQHNPAAAARDDRVSHIRKCCTEGLRVFYVAVILAKARRAEDRGAATDVAKAVSRDFDIF